MASEVHVVGPQAGHKHTHTVIFLHGRDSTGEEFADELFESEVSVGYRNAGEDHRTLPALLPTMRWVFPTARRLRSERFDTEMSQWFDMWSVESPEENLELQIPGLKQSIIDVLEVIRAEEALLPRQNIFLAGISQGFATALAAFFADGHGFAGLVGLCSWMPWTSVVESIPVSESDETVLGKVQAIYSAELSVHPVTGLATLKSTPVFLAHASDDEVVPVKNGKHMRDILTDRLRLAVDFHEYAEGGHWLNEPQGVEDIVDFIIKHM
ncbi:phospholipase/carboxylesterase [Coniochaeta ligniaria NRRL 30616]|uniref:Phospholipase/carboxylesterase n=1 Tax=Coniochaeta ligniaria NRRL 30616 TaxID=1408157 RepID=A0A1J7I8U0_9PEZI|nr:phospholipase/carboxylesterase [Coniochaeta ligniaria NRRL 30616]